jgi:hypothetical protein
MAPGETNGDDRPSKRQRGDIPKTMKALQYENEAKACVTNTDRLKVLWA